MCIWCKVKTSVVLEIHNKIEMKRTVKYKLGKGWEHPKVCVNLQTDVR